MKTLKEREWFYSQEKEPLELRNPAPYTIYRLKTTGQIVCEHTLDIGLGGKSVEIALLADTHFNLLVPEDMQDAESPYTYECRLWGRNGGHVEKARAALEGASYSDYMVVAGDIIDFLTQGSMMLTKRYIIDEYPEAMMTIGWHDITKQMQTRRPNLLTNSERINILREIWPHDLDYYRRDLSDKLIAICLGQTHTKYSSDIREKLSCDVEEARATGRKILIFQHEPFATGKPEDAAIKCSFYSGEEELTLNLYNKVHLMCRDEDTDEVNRGVYEIVTHSADVIKGVFVGHEHIQTYSEIPAKERLADGSERDAVIPQHIVTCTPYNNKGYYMRIMVK